MERNMKNIILLLVLIVSSFACTETGIKNYRLSFICRFRGYYYNRKCYCFEQFTGSTCRYENKNAGIYGTKSVCDNIIARLDHLLNIGPFNYTGDDNEFSRKTQVAIYKGDEVKTWYQMHSLVPDFSVFKSKIEAKDVKQGWLGDCYFLAAIASLANIDNGRPILNVFMTKTDTQQHVYITRWFINGKPRFVAVDDYVPALEKSIKGLIFGSVFGDHDFWEVILEKAWAKINGGYHKIEGGFQLQIWTALTQAPTNVAQVSKVTDVYQVVCEKLKNNYPVGTVSGEEGDLVNQHAYAVLKCYEIKLPGNKTQKLIKVFNPWNKATWETNPWGDNSKNWSLSLKTQVGKIHKNDGEFFLTPEDFSRNFIILLWAEYRSSYQGYTYSTELRPGEQKYTFYFYAYSDYNGPLYVFINPPNERFVRKECDHPLSADMLKITDPQKREYKEEPTVFYYNQTMRVKVPTTKRGRYKFEAIVTRHADWMKELSFSIYAKAGKIRIISR